MSYAVSGPLQAAVYTALTSDMALTALVGANIFDALPSGTLPDLYVALGPETVREAADKTGSGALHDFTVSVVSAGAGFQAAKTVAGAVSDALDGAALGLGRGALVGLWFRKARARREGGGLRRIDLTFRARVEDGA
jgi:hypothetical protein